MTSTGARFREFLLAPWQVKLDAPGGCLECQSSTTRNCKCELNNSPLMWGRLKQDTQRDVLTSIMLAARAGLSPRRGNANFLGGWERAGTATHLQANSSPPIHCIVSVGCSQIFWDCDYLDSGFGSPSCRTGYDDPEIGLAP